MYRLIDLVFGALFLISSIACAARWRTARSRDWKIRFALAAVASAAVGLLDVALAAGWR